MNNLKSIPIFFIICKGRSGSTLLANLLDANPNIQVPFENTFLMHLHPKYKNIKTWNKKNIDAFITDLFILRKTKMNWKIDKEGLREKLYSKLNHETNYASICQETYLSCKSIYPKKEILLIGDKNPFYTFCIDDIKEIYPEAKFIHLVRDARANVRSHIVSFKTRFLSFIALKWHYYNREVDAKKNIYPESFITVKYEDLVSNPENTLIKISHFLNINYTPDSLNFHTTVTNKLSNLIKYREGIHHNLKKPIDSSINEKWKHYFSKEQIGLINIICQKHLKFYSYEFEIKPISFFKKIEIISGKIYYKIWITTVKAFYASPFSIKKIAFKLMDILFK